MIDTINIVEIIDGNIIVRSYLPKDKEKVIHDFYHLVLANASYMGEENLAEMNPQTFVKTFGNKYGSLLDYNGYSCEIVSSVVFEESWNKNVFREGQIVIVPDPEKDDNWDHSFQGVISSIYYKNGEKMAEIEDCDFNCFDIEYNRLEPYFD